MAHIVHTVTAGSIWVEVFDIGSYLIGKLYTAQQVCWQCKKRCKFTECAQPSLLLQGTKVVVYTGAYPVQLCRGCFCTTPLVNKSVLFFLRIFFFCLQNTSVAYAYLTVSCPASNYLCKLWVVENSAGCILYIISMINSC